MRDFREAIVHEAVEAQRALEGIDSLLATLENDFDLPPAPCGIKRAPPAPADLSTAKRHAKLWKHKADRFKHEFAENLGSKVGALEG